MSVTWAEVNEHTQRVWQKERIATMEARLKAAKAAKAAKRATSVPAPEMNAGNGWRVTEPPGASSHDELERLAFQVFDLAFHSIPRPKWRVRWGEITPSDLLSYALACVDPDAKVIIVDRRYTQGRADDDLIETLFHEWTHVLHVGDGHGERFQKTVASVKAFMNELKQPMEPSAARPRPALVYATKGRRYAGFGRWGAPVPGGQDLEYR